MKKIKHETNVISVEVVRLVRVISRLGDGTPGDVVRHIEEYYDMEGGLVARVDGHANNAISGGSS